VTPQISRPMSKLFYVGPSLSTLHEGFAKRHRIDAGAPVTSSSDVVIERSPSTVWRVLVDLRGWSRWAPAQVVAVNEVHPDATFTWRLNGVTIQSKFAVVDPERELTWTGRFFGYRAVDRQTLNDLGGGRTRVTLEESLAGPLLSLLYPAAKLKENHEKWLTSLKAFVEGGSADRAPQA
jgi:hypothetical protein